MNALHRAAIACACAALLPQAKAATAATPAPQTAAPMAQDPAPAAAAKADARQAAQRRPSEFGRKQRNYYVTRWGIDKLKVGYTSSGNLIRFSYRVADPDLAKPLLARENTPYMLGVRSRALLQIPVMEKVGPLRQTATPEAGKEYWMVFSNKGNLVKPGDRVNVMIGAFRADGLMVE